MLHHHVVDHAGLKAAVFQLLHALILQRAVLPVGRECQATAGHPYTLLATRHRTRLRDAATTHSQEMPIDLRLRGHVGRGSPRPVDVGNQGCGRGTNDGIEVYPNAIRQRGQGKCSLLGAG